IFLRGAASCRGISTQSPPALKLRGPKAAHVKKGRWVCRWNELIPYSRAAYEQCVNQISSDEQNRELEADALTHGLLRIIGLQVRALPGANILSVATYIRK